MERLDGYVAAIVDGPVSISPPEWICPLLAIAKFNHGGSRSSRRSPPSCDITTTSATSSRSQSAPSSLCQYRSGLQVGVECVSPNKVLAMPARKCCTRSLFTAKNIPLAIDLRLLAWTESIVELLSPRESWAGHLLHRGVHLATKAPSRRRLQILTRSHRVGSSPR